MILTKVSLIIYSIKVQQIKVAEDQTFGILTPIDIQVSLTLFIETTYKLGDYRARNSTPKPIKRRIVNLKIQPNDI